MSLLAHHINTDKADRAKQARQTAAVNSQMWPTGVFQEINVFLMKEVRKTDAHPVLIVLEGKLHHV